MIFKSLYLQSFQRSILKKNTKLYKLAVVLKGKLAKNYSANNVL